MERTGLDLHGNDNSWHSNQWGMEFSGQFELIGDYSDLTTWHETVVLFFAVDEFGDYRVNLQYKYVFVSKFIHIDLFTRCFCSYSS